MIVSNGDLKYITVEKDGDDWSVLGWVYGTDDILIKTFDDKQDAEEFKERLEDLLEGDA